MTVFMALQICHITRHTFSTRSPILCNLRICLCNTQHFIIDQLIPHAHDAPLKMKLAQVGYSLNMNLTTYLRFQFSLTFYSHRHVRPQTYTVGPIAHLFNQDDDLL